MKTGTFDAVPHVGCQLASATNSSSEELHLATGLRPQLKEGFGVALLSCGVPSSVGVGRGKEWMQQSHGKAHRREEDIPRRFVGT